MIDPKLLTEENGFVDGCVVEIVILDGDWKTYHHGILKDCGRDCVVYECEGEEILSSVPFKSIHSIRPLTGPMAIWNFAPSWATHLDMEDGFFEFVNLKNDGVYDGYINRPLWAKETK